VTAASAEIVASRRARCGHDERGLTLIELMVSITISAMIMGVLASAAIMFFQHSSDNNNSYDDQSSIQNIQSLFTGDAQSATAVTLNDAAPCGSNNTAIVTFSWGDAGVLSTASWTVEQSSGIRTLMRRQCTNGTPIQSTDVGGVTGTPTITCTPACDTFTSVTITGVAQHGANFDVTGTRRVTTT
jgi:prepilin-type N-terminal cleavage/methylation domain-containing protein